MAKRIVDVLVPVALDQTYSYRVPGELDLAPGDLVRVPLGARECTAVVWANDATPDPRLDNRLKDVAAKLDIPPLKPELRKFVEWVSGYTLSPRGMVLRMALRMGEHLGPERVRVGIRVAGPPPQRMTAAPPACCISSPTALRSGCASPTRERSHSSWSRALRGVRTRRLAMPMNLHPAAVQCSQTARHT